MRRGILLFALHFLAAPLAFAQKSPNDAIGFNAEKLYDFHDLDAVSLFNGNLSITIPLSRMAVTSTLSTSLSLVYNGKVLDWEGSDHYSSNDTFYDWDPRPSLGSSAGLGWRVSLGRLHPPTGTSVNHSSFDRHNFIYEGPAGDEHEFPSSDDDAAVILSIDQAALRLVKITTEPYLTRDVEMPSGEVHRYQFLNFMWRLTRIRDRFNNAILIGYEYDSADTRREKRWLLTEQVNGVTGASPSHTLTFTHFPSMSGGTTRGMQLTSIDLTAPQGTTATYDFGYTTYSIPVTGSGLSVPLLTTLTLPDPDGTGALTSETYQFEYFTNATDSQGDRAALKKITYPTGGSTSYTYQFYVFANTADVCLQGPWPTQPPYATPGIKTRTISDGVNDRVWKYVQRRGPKVALSEHPQRCGDTVYGPFYWSRTSVLAPLDTTSKRTRTDYYFPIFGGLDSNEHPATPLPGNPGTYGTTGRPPADWAKGPVERVPEETPGYPADVSASDGTRLLTTQTYGNCDSVGDCTSGTLLRSVYTQGGSLTPFGSPPASTRTVYEDDSACGAGADEPCETVVSMSGDDGFGQFATAVSSSNFPGATAIITSTQFPVMWTSANRLDPTKKWIRDLYTEQSRSEGSVTARTLFDFDLATGRLLGRRVLQGDSPSAVDLLTLFNYSTTANQEDVVRERYYGGDGGGLATVAADLFAAPSMPPDYVFRHTFVHGVRSKTEYLTPSTTCVLGTEGTCATILTSPDYAIDPTGVVTTSRDISGVATSFSYDRAFRLTNVTLPNGGSKSYAYTSAAGTTSASATETRKNASGTVLGTATFEFDGLGRVKRSSTPLPGSKVAVVDTEYDEMGRARKVSQPVEQSAHPSTSVGADWTTTTYDALGRPVSITSPDSSVTSVAYKGAREIAKTSAVATSLTGTTNATTTEHYDGHGRLAYVVEKTADTSATMTEGGTITTRYQYDVGGRLESVRMYDSPTGPPAQTRLFTYDRRGFLTSESHPESGSTAYSGHDARGHALERVAGGRTVAFAFDAAERLTEVAEMVQLTPPPADPTKKILKVFTFFDSNTTAQRRLGRLKAALRRNELAAEEALDVTESYEYDLSGRMTKRATLVEHVQGTTRSTVQSFEYSTTHDDFDLPKVLTMPTCSAHGCSTASGLGTITLDRTVGFLTSVEGIASLTHHPSGATKTVQHLSTPARTDTYAVSHGIPRPSTITFEGGTACPDTTASGITAPNAVCAGSSGNPASVAPRSGITHTWAISAGATITSGTTGDSVTFTAPQSGVVTLTVTATDLCGATAQSSKQIALASPPSASTITAPSTVCAGSSGNTASVDPRAGITHTWTMTGGTIAGSATGNTLTFTAGSSGSAELTVTASDGCGSTPSSKTVALTPLPTATLTGSTTIVRPASTPLWVALTGSSPWTVTWEDGQVDANVQNSPLRRDVAPTHTTTYRVVSVSAGGCSSTTQSSATVTVLPPPPAWAVATTRENRIVDLSWAAVAGATAYQIERTTQRDGLTTGGATVGAVTAHMDTVPESSMPVTYIYYVRAIDGEMSIRGAFDFATAATTLYAQAQIVSGVTQIRASDIAELRRGIDAFRSAFGVGPAFASTPPPSGVIRATDFTDLIAALTAGRIGAGYLPFQYTGVAAPAQNGTVLGAHITQLREALR